VDRPRPGPTPGQQRADALLAVGLAACGLLTAELGRVQSAANGGPPADLVEHTAWVLAVTLPLALRRRLPVTTLLLVSAAFFGLGLRQVPENLVASVSLYLAVFTAGAWGRDRRVSAAARAVVVVAMFGLLSYTLFSPAYGGAALLDSAGGGLMSARTALLVVAYTTNAAYFAAAVAFGELAWRSAAQRALLEQRTAELEAEREQVAQRTREAERLVLARDLHDVVAHHVSLMGLQAGAARRALDRQPERAREALRQVELTSRTAVEELGRLLGLLRSGAGGAGAEGAPSVAGLPELVARAGGSGVAVELTVVGPPRALPPSVSASAYRVVQEALTNTLKHARATRADVRLRYLEDAVEVEVVDDGSAPATAAGPASRGQVGMAERVALHDGELDLGPRAVSGYRVRARFPTPPPGPEPAPAAVPQQATP
jgi:signal transduction histidine kinase